MDWESSDVVRFFLGTLFQGEKSTANLKMLITCLLLVLVVCNVKPACRKAVAENLLLRLGLTLGPSFKVKRG